MATQKPLMRFMCSFCHAVPCRCVASIQFADGNGRKGKWERKVTVTKARDHDGGYHLSVDGKRVKFNYHSSAVMRIISEALTSEGAHLGSIRIRFTSTRKPKRETR